MPARRWTRVNSDPRVVARPSDATDIRVHPTNPDIVFVPTIVTWKSTDGGKTFTAIRGAPGGDDYQRVWINPTIPTIIADVGSGRDHHAQRRRVVEQLVQPADRGVLSRHHRQRVSVSRLQRPAGERLGVHLEPRRRRADHVPRVAPGRRRGVRLRRARSARSRHRLRRQGVALGSPHRAGAEHRAEAAAEPPTIASSARCRCCSRRSIRASCTSRRTCCGRRRTAATAWDQISPDLTRKDWEVPDNVGNYIGSDAARPTPARRDLHDRAVVPRREHHLGRHRRRADSRDARRRQDVERRDAAGADAVVEGVDHGRVALRRRTPLTPRSTRSGSTICGRTSIARATAARPGRTSPAAFPTAASSTSCAKIRSGAACCLPAPSRRSTCRSTTAITGSRCGYNMPATSIRDLVIKDDDLVVGTHGRSFWILDDITPLRQIAAEHVRRGCAPVRAAAGVALPLEQEHRHAAAAGRAGRPESARRRDHQLLAEAGRAQRRSRSKILDAAGAWCASTRATIRWSRWSRAATRPTTGCVRTRRCRREPGLHRFVWDMHHERPAVDRLLVSDRGDIRQHAAHAVWIVGAARQLHVRLTVDGKTQTQPLVVKMDPRVKTPPAASSCSTTRRARSMRRCARARRRSQAPAATATRSRGCKGS